MKNKKRLALEKFCEMLRLYQIDPLKESWRHISYDEEIKKIKDLVIEFSDLMAEKESQEDIDLSIHTLVKFLDIFNPLLSCFCNRDKMGREISNHRKKVIEELIERDNYHVSTNHVFFHIHDCTFYAELPFFKETNFNLNSTTQMTLIEVKTMLPIKLECKKEEEKIKFYKKIVPNKLIEIPLYSLAQLGCQEFDTTTNELYLMEKYYSKRLKKEKNL